MLARDNPFSADRIERLLRYRLEGETWPGLLARLCALRWRAAIVGPHGSGKTTLLEELTPRLRALGFHPLHLQLNRQRRRLSPRDLKGRFLLLDGAEQLSRLSWWRFRFEARAAAGLLITLHRPARLPTLLETETSPALLDRLLGELVPDPAAWRHPAHLLFTQHEGNIREVLRSLYDLCATGDGSRALAAEEF